MASRVSLSKSEDLVSHARCSSQWRKSMERSRWSNTASIAVTKRMNLVSGFVSKYAKWRRRNASSWASVSDGYWAEISSTDWIRPLGLSGTVATVEKTPNVAGRSEGKTRSPGRPLSACIPSSAALSARNSIDSATGSSSGPRSTPRRCRAKAINRLARQFLPASMAASADGNGPPKTCRSDVSANFFSANSGRISTFAGPLASSRTCSSSTVKRYPPASLMVFRKL